MARLMTSQHRRTQPEPNCSERKRKRQSEPTNEPDDERPRTRTKRQPHALPVPSSNEGNPLGNRLIEYWNEKGGLPPEYFKPNEDTQASLRSDLEGEDRAWHSIRMERGRLEQGPYAPFLARQKSSSSLRAPSESASTASDQRPRDEKCAPYRSPRFEIWLKSVGIFLEEDEQGLDNDSLAFIQQLLKTSQSEPQDTVFTDNIFKAMYRRLRIANVSKLIYRVSPLLCLSVEELVDRGFKGLEYVVDSVNEGWNGSQPLKRPRPQLDYALVFDCLAFKEQLPTIQPFIGELEDTSLFKATYSMLFLFFTYEVKCGATGLDVVDR